jgi:hypothetical protein
MADAATVLVAFDYETSNEVGREPTETATHIGHDPAGAGVGLSADVSPPLERNGFGAFTTIVPQLDVFARN